MLRFYTNNLTFQRKKSPQREGTSLLKYCFALVAVCAFAGYITWQRAQTNQEIRELRNELKECEIKRNELVVDLHNLNGELEREKDFRKINDLAISLKLGLRQPPPNQLPVIVQMDGKHSARKRPMLQKMVGSTK